MTREVARREIDSLDYYLQNHTDDYSEESHTAMMMAISALSENKGEWIIYGFPSSEQIKNCTEDYYCSECKFVVSRFESRACNFCPTCGADMRGET